MTDLGHDFMIAQWGAIAAAYVPQAELRGLDDVLLRQLAIRAVDPELLIPDTNNDVALGLRGSALAEATHRESTHNQPGKPGC